VGTRYGVCKITPNDTLQRVIVWDLPTRAFHWLGVVYLALSFCVVYIKLPVALHIASGAAIAWLYAGRLVWGFMGSKYTLFRRFFLRDSFETGHTKFGWIAYFVMIFLVFLIAISGIYLLALKTRFLPATKELADFATLLHEIPSNLLLFIVIIHLDGVFLHIFMHRQNIVRSMIDGKKLTSLDEHPKKLTRVQKIFALIWIIGSIAVFGFVYDISYGVKLESFALC